MNMILNFLMQARFYNGGYAGMNYYNSIYLPGDYNGDGFIDIFHFVNTHTARIWFGNGTGKFDIKHNLLDEKFDFVPIKYFTLKFQNESKDKIVVIKDSTSFYVVESNNQIFEDKTFTAKNEHVLESNNYFFLKSNFYGDKIMNILHVINGDEGIGFYIFNPIGTDLSSYDFDISNVYSLNQNQKNQTFIIGDFDGDGKSDIMSIIDEYNTLISFSKGDGTFNELKKFPNSAYRVSTNNYKFFSGKFTNKTRNDLIHIINDTSYHMWLSNGDGTFNINEPIEFYSYNFSSNNYNLQVIDMDNDGYDDIVHFYNESCFYIFYSLKNGAFNCKPYNYPNYNFSKNNYNILVVDLNNDKRPDLLHFQDTNYSVAFISKYKPAATSFDLTVNESCINFEFSQFISDNDLNETLQIKISGKPNYGLLYHCNNTINKYSRINCTLEGKCRVVEINVTYTNEEFYYSLNNSEIVKNDIVEFKCVDSYHFEHFYYSLNTSETVKSDNFEFKCVDSDGLESNTAYVNFNFDLNFDQNSSSNSNFNINNTLNEASLDVDKVINDINVEWKIYYSFFVNPFNIGNTFVNPFNIGNTFRKA
ncbi:hypothetical protein SteCoe_28063 [Stentor coeruleus]|uniref:Uncharacterized protein n=1 Tax=Stentor coeruleus TaxID=5963 RepID=A0A1R2B924_9CILI|nr:hypothetical protein SteCoe_28063 [Stentor coeruleus]